jgi:hypothetical protein
MLCSSKFSIATKGRTTIKEHIFFLAGNGVKKIASFEVFKKISDLREVIQKRKLNKYIPDKALTQFSLLSERTYLGWTEATNNLKSQKRPMDQISLLVQYAFAIPETSTEVSIINEVWGSNKGHLSFQMLEAIVNVKINRNLSCIKFYESIKYNKKLLQKFAAKKSTKK